MLDNPSERIGQTESDLEDAASSASSTLTAAEADVAGRYAVARHRLRERWADAKTDLGQLRRRAYDYSQCAARATNTYAHEHPWTTAGAAVGLGALLGWLVTRRWDLRD